MGKVSKKEWIYVYVYQIHFAVHLKQPQHCIPQYIQYIGKYTSKKFFFKKEREKKKEEPRQF